MGKRHGDIKDNNPAAKAIPKDRLDTASSPYT